MTQSRVEQDGASIFVPGNSMRARDHRDNKLYRYASRVSRGLWSRIALTWCDRDARVIGPGFDHEHLEAATERDGPADELDELEELHLYDLVDVLNGTHGLPEPTPDTVLLQYAFK